MLRRKLLLHLHGERARILRLLSAEDEHRTFLRNVGVYQSTRRFVPEDLNRGLKNFLLQMLVQFRTHRRPCAVYYLFVLQHYKMIITRIYQHPPDLLRRGDI